MILEIALSVVALAVASGGALWLVYRVPVEGGPMPSGTPEMTPPGFIVACQTFRDMASRKEFECGRRQTKINGLTWRKINVELREVGSVFRSDKTISDFTPVLRGNCDNFAVMLFNRLVHVGIDKAALRLFTAIKGGVGHVGLIIDTDHGAYAADLGAQQWQPAGFQCVPGLGIEKITLIQQAGSGEWERISHG